MSKQVTRFSDGIWAIVGLGFLILVGYWVISGIVNVVTDQGSSHATQTYWYCWNSGAPEPHHLGHHVSGDHYCTDHELATKK